MRKLILAFLLCFSLNVFSVEQNQFEVESGTINSSHLLRKKKKISHNKNKELFSLQSEKFSNSQDIDYDGLEKHIRYQFKDRELLKNALFPMIPKRLRADELTFERLECWGDCVLGFIIKERLFALFPNERRSIIVELYTSMIQNKTLGDVYFRSLAVERYLPLPEEKGCEMCNVVESLIGGIYLDDSDNGLINSKKFVMWILDDHLLEEKIREVSSRKGNLRPAILPQLNEVIKIVCTPQKLASYNPKTLLNEVLLRVWNDRPTYKFSVNLDEEGQPRFSAIVSGAQIGNSLQGEGDTRQEAEEDAAGKALNFLAKQELSQKKDKTIAPKDLKIRLKEALDMLGYSWEIKNITPPKNMKVQIRFQDEIVGEGIGNSKKDAEEMAAHKACGYFRKNFPFEKDSHQRSKKYKSLLKEFSELAGSNNYKLGEAALSQGGYQCQIEMGANIVIKGTGYRKAEAEEDAAQKAFLFLRKENAENYGPLLQLFLMLEGLDGCKFNVITPCQTFIFQVLDVDKVLAEGAGFDKKEAEGRAVKEACLHLKKIEEEKIEREKKLKHAERLERPNFEKPRNVPKSHVKLKIFNNFSEFSLVSFAAGGLSSFSILLFLFILLN